MSGAQLSCPGCGAAIVFKIGSSIVAVCAQCGSAVARGDRLVEDLGKVAALADSGSRFGLLQTGTWRRVGFQLVGRAQLSHPAGGTWDEWYAAFSDGRWGWLAEASGRFYLTFEKEAEDRAGELPAYEALEVGAQPSGLPAAVPLTVAEIGEARALAAEGEIPYRLVPGETYRFADLSGSAGEFATLHYGAEGAPAFYFGREVNVEELGFPPALGDRVPAKQVAGVHLSCPNCAGALSLHAPDEAQRVTCPSCGGLLDVDHGNLRYLQALDSRGVKPRIPLGTVGTLRNTRLTVLGFLRRSIAIEGLDYFWTEYLLYASGSGFRWLVHSDDHWSLVSAIPPGQVIEIGSAAHFKGQKFRKFQRGEAKVETVLGEFYWKVAKGETVETCDYVCPPRILSREASVTRAPEPPASEPQPGKTGAQERGPKKGKLLKQKPPKRPLAAAELNWSLGEYLEVAEVEAAFGVKGLPRPHRVGANEPFRYKSMYRRFAWAGVALLVAGLLVLAASPRREVLRQEFFVEPQPGATSHTALAEAVEIAPRQNLRVDVACAVVNGWVFVSGDLTHLETNQSYEFGVPIAYYSGQDADGSWSEGSQSAAQFLSALPAGRYGIRLEFQWEAGKPAPPPIVVTLRQGVPRFSTWALACGLIGVLPLVVALWHLSFEKLRWSESMYGS